jgi:hypothetical protein
MALRTLERAFMCDVRYTSGPLTLFSLKIPLFFLEKRFMALRNLG